jgi:hypothetical protein
MALEYFLAMGLITAKHALCHCFIAAAIAFRLIIAGHLQGKSQMQSTKIVLYMHILGYNASFRDSFTSI